MIQKEAPARAEKLSSLNSAPPATATMAKKRFEEFAEIQSDLVEEIREAGQNWLDRMQSEATLASDFSSKRWGQTVQEWAKRRMELQKTEVMVKGSSWRRTQFYRTVVWDGRA